MLVIIKQYELQFKNDIYNILNQCIFERINALTIE